MDLDLWLRMTCQARITLVEQHLSWMRQHNDLKTWRDTLYVLDEVQRVLLPYSGQVAPEVLKRTYALARRNRSRAWVAIGLASISRGDRRSGWSAAFRAARVQVGVIGSRGWVGLILRLTLPRPARQLMFRPHPGDSTFAIPLSGECGCGNRD